MNDVLETTSYTSVNDVLHASWEVTFDNLNYNYSRCGWSKVSNCINSEESINDWEISADVIVVKFHSKYSVASDPDQHCLFISSGWDNESASAYDVKQFTCGI